jgi:hypothetical protein
LKIFNPYDQKVIKMLDSGVESPFLPSLPMSPDTGVIPRIYPPFCTPDPMTTGSERAKYE